VDELDWPSDCWLGRAESELGLAPRAAGLKYGASAAEVGLK
jgi:hypothetical protein